MRYEVLMTATYTVEIEARNEDEAAEKALDGEYEFENDHASTVLAVIPAGSGRPN